MAPKRRPRVDDLQIPTAARFVRLKKPLTKRGVGQLFRDVLQETQGRRVSQVLRAQYGAGPTRFTCSFMCFRLAPAVKFLINSPLEEIHYGFLLLVERRKHLAVFHSRAKGIDRRVSALSRPVDRGQLTHIWADQARYQRFSTRRMTVSQQELRGASYSAENLEIALAPALAGRSVVRTLGLATRDHGVVGITPSTGRLRVQAGRVILSDLFEFVDVALDGLELNTRSDFLSAFPAPVDVEDLDASVEPMGVLVDNAQLVALLDDPNTSLTTAEPGKSTDSLLQQLSPVLFLNADGNEWVSRDASGDVVARVKRLKHSFRLRSDLLAGWNVEDAAESRPLEGWVREENAFSICFSVPEYFYSGGALFRSGGLREEAALVRAFFEPHADLAATTAEKGDAYEANDTRFRDHTVFRAVEDVIAATDEYLLCGDLGDEWADYLGANAQTITFYHCKHGEPSTGASGLQIVTAQAVKNLSRVKYRANDIRHKLGLARQRGYWGKTQIPLLVRSPGDWNGLEAHLTAASANPTVRWRVAIVVDSLSAASFDAEVATGTYTPHFIQLVWLLSGFVSACRERDANAVIVCRP